MKTISAILIWLALSMPCFADDPRVKIGLVPVSTRMAPHACFAYLIVDPANPNPTDQSKSATGTSCGWHECSITWQVLDDEYAPITGAITLPDPRPFAPAATVDLATAQKGFVCWFTFESAGSYYFSATVTNNNPDDDPVTAYSAEVVVVSDSRDYEHVDPVNGSDTNGDGSAQSPWQTWYKAKSMVSSGNGGILLKAGSDTEVFEIWNAQGYTNLRIDIDGGATRALLRADEDFIFYDIPEPPDFVNLFQNCQNVLFRNIDFIADECLQAVSGVGASAQGTGVSRAISVVNSTATSLGTHCGASVDENTTTPPSGFAVVNCRSIDPRVNSAYIDGYSNVVVLGLSVQNNAVSHVLRMGSDPAGVLAFGASVGYCDCDVNYAFDAEGNADRHAFKTYLPFTFAYNNYFRNGSVSIESGEAWQSSTDCRVFDACYFKNGKIGCARIAGLRDIRDVRFSGCVFEVENNYRAHGNQAEYGEDRGWPALQIALGNDVSGLILEGVTVLVGDEWPSNPQTTDPLFTVDEDVGVLTDSSLRNLLVLNGFVGDEFLGPFVQIPEPDDPPGITFESNCWEVVDASPFKVGSSNYDFDTWLTFTDFVLNDVNELNDRDEVVAQSLRPNRFDQPIACASSAAAAPSYTDYFGSPFNPVSGTCGAVAACLADFNGDGFVDGIDSEDFDDAFGSEDPLADINNDGFVDGTDYDLFYYWFEIGCPNA